MHNMFHRDQTNVSWFKIGGTKFGSPVHGGKGVIFRIFGKFQKAPMWKDNKKMHSKFYLDQMN